MTIINFDENNINYDLVKDNSYNEWDGLLHQFSTNAVITKENILLSEPRAIKLLILNANKMRLDTAVVTKDVSKGFTGVSYQLKKLGYLKSLNYWEKFVDEYKKRAWILKMLILIKLINFLIVDSLGILFYIKNKMIREDVILIFENKCYNTWKKRMGVNELYREWKEQIKKRN